MDDSQFCVPERFHLLKAIPEMKYHKTVWTLGFHQDLTLMKLLLVLDIRYHLKGSSSRSMTNTDPRLANMALTSFAFYTHNLGAKNH